MMIFAILVFVVDMIAITQVVGSRCSIAGKLAWIVGILLLPIIGAFAWLLAGPRFTHHSSAW